MQTIHTNYQASLHKTQSIITKKTKKTLSAAVLHGILRVKKGKKKVCFKEYIDTSALTLINTNIYAVQCKD